MTVIDKNGDMRKEQFIKEIRLFVKRESKKPNVVIFDFRYLYEPKEFKSVIESIEQKRSMMIVYKKDLNMKFVLSRMAFHDFEIIMDTMDDEIPF